VAYTRAKGVRTFPANNVGSILAVAFVTEMLGN
jgi:hypothetical protein